MATADERRTIQGGYDNKVQVTRHCNSYLHSVGLRNNLFPTVQVKMRRRSRGAMTTMSRYCGSTTKKRAVMIRRGLTTVEEEMGSVVDRGSRGS